MNELLKKISSYHLFNYLLPGCLFAILATKMTGRTFIQQNLILGLFLYYFCGLLISRIGSLVIEPILRKSRFLKFADYRDFVTACKKDPKIDVLSEANNSYRTLCSLILVLIAVWAFARIEEHLPLLHHAEEPILIVITLGLLLFSYRKQTEYIAKRVTANQEP